ncbi:membrane protein [Streptococcus pyogenes JRS4]|uniref:Phage shock protein PspC N-terminal domain-containing protein n=5 Tax=Streptococcus pyogenes TaxID=1314 RepID=Q9A0W6_STRP1|nr:PspC domain-containing protein [Streptococcus pyogenes]ABF35547.1 Stress-responsive transcriptional regulator PspC [Streptococcus pyogenes MGAS2096]AIG50073.1 membrane protein [Streptococcus pyogenes STAB901]EPZ43109.1 PspC domain protein [Streptococcus pyogenes GA41345]EPZ48206.1 PspC domain protein [Streptococcus pyogenes GA40634]EQL77869.1 PspC domain protein [Streptococcus pyogenes GA19681]EQL78850.1 PspC domain protein [Streptococcus pyogenes UTSW-2]ERL09082.1 PspC domain protein [St
METKFYKQRKNRLVAGVIAGLADKYGWDLALARVLAALLIYGTGFGVLLYILLAIFLPYKEDLLEERYGRGPRRRKDADVLNEEEDGWFW